MNKKEIESFAKEAAKGIKTPDDLNQFSQMLKKITIEAALNAEMVGQVSAFRLKRVNLNWIRHVIVMAVLNLSSSKNTHLGLLRWMTKYSGSMPKA